MKRFSWSAWLFIGLICLVTGCRSDEAAIQAAIDATVEQEVASLVQQTVAALPTATAYNTLTPYPTYTPAATYTPRWTATPQNTYTPYPTYTSLPTATASVTSTPTLDPTATATLRATVNATQAAPTIAPINNAVLMHTTISGLLQAINDYRSAVMDGFYTYAGGTDVECQRLVNAFDRASQAPILDVSNDEPLVQDAYAQYYAQLSRFMEVSTGWATACREALAIGEESKRISPLDRSVFDVTFREIEQVLNPINDSLRQLQGGG